MCRVTYVLRNNPLKLLEFKPIHVLGQRNRTSQGHVSMPPTGFEAPPPGLAGCSWGAAPLWSGAGGASVQVHPRLFILGTTWVRSACMFPWLLQETSFVPMNRRSDESQTRA